MLNKYLLNVMGEVRKLFNVKLEEIPPIKKIKEESKKKGVIKTILRLLKKKYLLNKTHECIVPRVVECAFYKWCFGPKLLQRRSHVWLL